MRCVNLLMIVILMTTMGCNNSTNSTTISSDSSSVSETRLNTPPQRTEIQRAAITFNLWSEHTPEIDSISLTDTSAVRIRRKYNSVREWIADSITIGDTIRLSDSQTRQLWRIINESIMTSISPLCQYVDSLKEYDVASQSPTITVELLTSKGIYRHTTEIRDKAEGYVYTPNLLELYRLLTGVGLSTDRSIYRRGASQAMQ